MRSRPASLFGLRHAIITRPLVLCRIYVSFHVCFSSHVHRQSTLETLGYICEEMAAIHDDVLSQEEINAVLTAVVQASVDVRCQRSAAVAVCAAAGCCWSLAPELSIEHCRCVFAQGMQKNEQDNDVRLAATTALFNALEFAHSNFNNDSERNYLMQVCSDKHACGVPCI